MFKLKKQFYFSTLLIVTMLTPQARGAESIEAGPLWSNADAGRKCPGICGAKGMNWNGQWRTTIPMKMSVCDCAPKAAQQVTQPVQAQQVQPSQSVQTPPTQPQTVQAASPEDYLKQFTPAELQQISSGWVTVVLLHSVKVNNEDYLLSTAKLDLTKSDSKRIFVLIPVRLIGSREEFVQKHSNRLALDIKVEASYSNLIKNASVTPDLSGAKIGPEWQKVPFSFVATDVEDSVKPVQAQSSQQVQSTASSNKQVFPENFTEVKNCGTDAKCREAARDKIDTDLLNAIMAKKTLTPEQSEYRKKIWDNGYNEEITPTQDDIFMNSSELGVKSQW